MPYYYFRYAEKPSERYRRPPRNDAQEVRFRRAETAALVVTVLVIVLFCVAGGFYFASLWPSGF